MTTAQEVIHELTGLHTDIAKGLDDAPTGIEPGYDARAGVTYLPNGKARYRKGGSANPSSSFLRQISLSVTANTWTRVPWRTTGAVLSGTNLTHEIVGGAVESVHPVGFGGAAAFIYAAHAGFVWAADAGWRNLAIMEDDGAGPPPSKSIHTATSLLLDGSSVWAQTVSCLIYHTADIRYSVWVLSDTNTSLSTGDIGGWGEAGETFFHMYHLGTVT